eukprot:Gb_04215 [translate_table: standard]
MARTRPGMDFPLDFPSSLSQRGAQAWLCPTDEGLKSVTVIEVLKYSRTWVIIPSFTVQTCTQYTDSSSRPSTKTLSPKAVIDSGTNENCLWVDTPVSKRIICWQQGGPWNHHSKSEAKILCTVSASPDPSAAYNSPTTRLFSSSSTTTGLISVLASSNNNRLDLD